MLTKYDEFLCHQVATTFDHVDTSAREWTERVIVHFGHTEGKCHLSLGFGLYPNRNVIDAFALLNVDNKTQYTVRASRELCPQPDEVKVGPFSYEIVQPLKKVRCRLDDNQYGLSYDIEFDGIMLPGWCVRARRSRRSRSNYKGRRSRRAQGRGRGPSA